MSRFARYYSSLIFKIILLLIKYSPTLASDQCVIPGCTNYWSFDKSFVDQMNPSISLYNARSFSWVNNRICTKNSALYLNNGYIQIKSSNVSWTGDFTITAWVFLMSRVACGKLLDCGIKAQNELVINLNSCNGDGLALQIYRNRSVSEFVYNRNRLEANKWKHVAFSLNNGTILIYTGGVVVATGKTHLKPNVRSNYGSCFIGKSQWDNNPNINAYIDDLSMFNRGLSLEEIQMSMYNPTTTMKTTTYTTPSTTSTTSTTNSSTTSSSDNIQMVLTNSTAYTVTSSPKTISYEIQMTLTNSATTSSTIVTTYPNNLMNDLTSSTSFTMIVKDSTTATTPLTASNILISSTTSTSSTTLTTSTTSASSTTTIFPGMVHFWNFNSNLLDMITNTYPSKAVSYFFVPDRFNNANSAVFFKSGYAQISTNLNIIDSFSLTVWINVQSFSKNYARVLDCGTSSLGQDNIVVAIREKNSNSPYVRVWNNGFGKFKISGTSLSLKTWTFYSISLTSQGFATMYINSKVSTKNIDVLKKVTRTNCYIAKSNWADDDNAIAYFDDLRIFSYALTADQMLTVMNTKYI